MREQQGYIYDVETQRFDDDAIIEDLPRRNRTTQTPEEYDDEEPRSRPTSTRRYTSRQPATPPRSVVRYSRPVPARTSARTNQQPATMRPRDTDDIPAQKATPHKMRRNAGYWIVRGGGVMIIMIVGHMFLSFVGDMWQTIGDNITYGYPRTTSYSQVLSKTDKAASDFTAKNDHCHLYVIVMEQGYSVNTSLVDAGRLDNAGCDLVPVKLKFEDVNGDDKVDMIVQAGGIDSIFLYDKTDKHLFRPATSDDKISI